MSKDNDNQTRMRQWLIRRLPGFYSYITQLPDTNEEKAIFYGDDGGKKFMQKVTDYIMAELGHPVKTASAFEKAWRHVFGG